MRCLRNRRTPNLSGERGADDGDFITLSFGKAVEVEAAMLSFIPDECVDQQKNRLHP